MNGWVAEEIECLRAMIRNNSFCFAVLALHTLVWARTLTKEFSLSTHSFLRTAGAS